MLKRWTLCYNYLCILFAQDNNVKFTPMFSKMYTISGAIVLTTFQDSFLSNYDRGPSNMHQCNGSHKTRLKQCQSHNHFTMVRWPWIFFQIQVPATKEERRLPHFDLEDITTDWKEIRNGEWDLKTKIITAIPKMW